MNQLVVKSCTAPRIPEGVLRLDYQSAVDGCPDWALAWPPTEGTTWLVQIHGHGSHGDQLFTREDIRQSWLPQCREPGWGILTPNLRDNSWMGPAAAMDMHDLLNVVRERWGARQFLFCSGSMGGTSNLIYAALHPEDVAGLMALCPATDLARYHAWCRNQDIAILNEIASAIEQAYGGLPSAAADLYCRHSAVSNARRLTMPVCIIHGNRDATIPVSESRRLVSAMADAPNLLYMEIPDGHHDSPLAEFPSALEWIVKRLKT